MLYTLGFVGFVTNLKRNQLRRQFGLFCWIHMSLLLIVVSSHFIVNNILEGIIWFWLPASLVIMNDIAAYVWGKRVRAIMPLSQPDILATYIRHVVRTNPAHKALA